MRHQLSLSVLLFALFLPICNFARADSSTDYQKRGGYSEGIKNFAISSYDIDLLSATTLYHEPTPQMPGRMRIHFYLSNSSSQVAITVREVDNKAFYWLDNVVHADPWQTGANEFSWTTAPVLKPLSKSDGLTVTDLGVVANLASTIPSGDMTVAPVLFYHDKLPLTNDGYEFAFKTDENARLVCEIYSVKTVHKLYSQPFPRVAANAPFIVRWACRTMPDGWYRLVIRGYTLGSNDPINLIVNFYHHRIVT